MGYAPRMAINYYGPSDDVLLNSTSQENTTSYKTYVKVKEITIRERIVSSGFRAKIEGKGDNAATISKFQVKINGVGTGNTVQIDADVWLDRDFPADLENIKFGDKIELYMQVFWRSGDTTSCRNFRLCGIRQPGEITLES